MTTRPTRVAHLLLAPLLATCAHPQTVAPATEPTAPVTTPEAAPTARAYTEATGTSDDGAWTARLFVGSRERDPTADQDRVQVQLTIDSDASDVLAASVVAPRGAPSLSLRFEDGSSERIGPQPPTDGPWPQVDVARRHVAFPAVPLPADAWRATALEVSWGLVRVATWDTHELTLARRGETAQGTAGPFALRVTPTSESADLLYVAASVGERDDDLGRILTHRWAATAAEVTDAQGNDLACRGGSGSGGFTAGIYARDDGAPVAYPVTVRLRVPARWRIEPVTFRWSPLELPTPLDDAGAPIPGHLREFPGLFARQGDGIVHAPAADVAVARSYARRTARGPLAATGERLTLLAAKSVYAADEEIRVVHVYEATRPGTDVYVMGPKAIFGESVDGVPTTPRDPPLAPYSGLVLPSPRADWNFEVTTYRLPPGRHVLRWTCRAAFAPDDAPLLVSNDLTVDVR